MDQLEAFKIYLAVRIAFIYNQPELILTGRFPKMWQNFEMTRKDLPLVKSLIKMSNGGKRTLLRLCVGNFLYGNKDFLYAEQHTERLMNNHLDYMRNIDLYLQNELDIIQIRIYNNGNLKKYLSSNKLLDDVFSRVIHMETLCLLYLANNEFIPDSGMMFDDIIQRIKIGSVFIELTEDRKNLILKYTCE